MVRRSLVPLIVPLLAALPLAGQQRAGFDLSVHGTILVNGFRNSARVNNSDVPTIALLPDPTAPSASAAGGAIRQTRLRLEARRDEVLGGRLFAEIDADFFGGQQPSGGGRTHPLLRIRRAYGEIRWDRVTLLVGQEAPPLFGVSPASIASTGFPLFASSGNLWLWLPQVRATGWLVDGRVRVGLEGTVLAPSAAEPQDPFLTEPDRAESSGRPALEGRLVARWQVAGREGEAGAGWHQGWLLDDAGRRLSSRAFGAALQAPVTGWLELRGEFFDGRAVAGLGGGGIGQNLNLLGDPIRSQGAWGQLILLPHATVELGIGVGVDNPRDGDLTGTAPRSRNRAWSAGITWRPAPVIAGFEVRRIATSYGTAAPTRVAATHLNVGLGIEF